jgi:hypothetical protein
MVTTNDMTSCYNQQLTIFFTIILQLGMVCTLTLNIGAILTVDHPISVYQSFHVAQKDIFTSLWKDRNIFNVYQSFPNQPYTKNQDLIPSLGKKSGLNSIAQRIETYQLCINNLHVNEHMKNQDLVPFPSLRLAFSTYPMFKSKNQAGISPS